MVYSVLLVSFDTFKSIFYLFIYIGKIGLCDALQCSSGPIHSRPLIHNHARTHTQSLTDLFFSPLKQSYCNYYISRLGGAFTWSFICNITIHFCCWTAIDGRTADGMLDDAPIPATCPQCVISIPGQPMNKICMAWRLVPVTCNRCAHRNQWCLLGWGMKEFHLEVCMCGT